MAELQDQNQPFAFEAAFNHIVLPAQLPGKEDHDVNAVASDLLNTVATAVRDIRDLTYDRYYRHFSFIQQSLSSYRQVCIDGILNKQVLLQQFRSLEIRDQLILHVTKQNAALLVRRENGPRGDFIVFEAFEASPTSEKALEAESALQWDFPATAVSIPYSTFSATGFQEELVIFLEQASKESIKRFAAVTAKAASGAWESRDTVDPSLITDLMMTLLEATGSQITPNTLRKRVRDDVCWNDGVNPWRRNPIWLILRVAVQRHLQFLSGPEVGTIHYKFVKCLLLQSFLRQVYNQIDPERTTILRTKLCRRMAKLEAARLQAPKKAKDVYNYFLEKINPKIISAIDVVDTHIQNSWDQYCQKIERRVNPLPRRADAQDTTLTLPNSSRYLNSVLDDPRIVLRSAQLGSRSNRQAEVPKDGRRDFAAFADKYYKYFALEDNLRHFNNAYNGSTDTPAEKCIRLSRQLEKYLDSVTGLYQGIPEALSGLILNVLELWIAVDGYAVQHFPLLADYHPVLTSEILISLHVGGARDFERVQKIGEYLRHRVQSSTSRISIFVDPVKGCFADRYVESPVTGGVFQELEDYIEASAEASRLRKEAEWREKSKEYETLTQQILITACQYYLSDDMPPIQYHDDRNCKKCFLERKARRIRITAHEHPLPADSHQLRAALFELACPPAFAAYRDVSWRIITTLALPGHRPPSEPRLLIQQYSELAPFCSRNPLKITLASNKKSFLQTHLAEVSLPTALEKVCLPNGLALAYYDTDRKIWPGRLNLSTTFYHHFPLPIPENSPFALLINELDPVHPPSSYDVIASQTRCPAGMNVHEFLAYQGLLGGWNRRLPSVLVELASSNLNFSSEATTSLVRYLTHQAGPSFSAEPLRMVHKIFRDPHFSTQLLDQIEYRLGLISSNWREVHCMEMLIMLISRGVDIWTLRSECPEPLARAIGMLRKVRLTISTWLHKLRDEIYGAETTDSSKRFSEFALWAALLGRSTYFVHGQHGSLFPLDTDQIKFFIECSIMLQHSLVIKPESLPSNLKRALVRDLKVVHSIKALLRAALAAYPVGLSSALGIAWAQEENTEYLDLEMLPAPNEWWIQMGIAATKTKREQIVLFHLLEGHLLLDGKPLGQLPPEHRSNPILRTLFGNRNLLTVPSRLAGMTYMISTESNTHRVHLGFRDRTMIVRAEWKDPFDHKKTLIEYVPPSVFKSDSYGEDLPASLLDDCFHWLDLQRRLLFVRKVCWKRKESDWYINLDTNEAFRRGVKLVDRFSPLFKRVATIFSRFEFDRFLTVFQPHKRPLSVEMRRLELRWEVNGSGYLESEALQSYIDKNQDAGTWYGLRSKIVLRDSANGRARSIIVPLGQPRCRLNGSHVEMDIMNVGVYGRYQINTVLGRVDCPPEPRLLYTKALIHAYTSFILPDPLTKRTGTEESLHCLRSGYCQPWAPLNPVHYPLLETIANLTPIREYYPVGLKVMQKVTWDTHLRSYAQNEHFFFVVKEIIGKSEQLRLFSRDKTDPFILDRQNCELYKRSKERRGLYERNSSNYSPKPTKDLVYQSRGRPAVGQTRRLNVYAAVYHLENWDQMLPLPCDLAGILEKWQNIGGFGNILDKILLSDKLSIDLPLFWGSLVKLCQSSSHLDKYKLMFLFSALVYNNSIDMDAVRTLISFATNPALKTCELPSGACFENFRRNPTIKADNLRLLIKPYCRSYKKSEFQSAVGFTLNAKLRKKLEAAEAAFNSSVETECNKLIDHLLQQWPCLQPTITIQFDFELIELSQVLPIIQPEWSRLFFNLQLCTHTREVQRVLDLFNALSTSPKPSEVPMKQPIEGIRVKKFESRSSLGELLQRSGPSTSVERLQQFLQAKRETISSQDRRNLVRLLNPPPHGKEIHELEGIIYEISRTDSVVRQRYAKDLHQSLKAFRNVSGVVVARNTKVFPFNLGSKIDDCLQRVLFHFTNIQQAIEGDERTNFWLKLGNLLPCVTIVSLLETIRSCNKSSFGPGMRESLVLLGLSITDVQQLIRVETYRLRNDGHKSSEEEQNPGHQNWEPLEFPDWLLLEIDSNILIRPDQVEVAHATIQPASGNNSVLQMNMGQGKTSCIMPMAASVLADSKKLLRVVVPRALLLQTVQIIHARLGGLVGREVRHVPFSRQTSTSAETIKGFHDIHLKILKSSGLMICLPEHTLSFMLSGLQRLCDGKIEEAKPMVRLQGWLGKFSRDILDESDFTLAVRTQLIYPSGSQKAFDGHPQRWKTAEALLQLVEGYLSDLQQQYPRSLEVVRRPTGGYPFIYFLRRDAEETLIKRLVNDICTGKTTILPMTDQPLKVQRAVKEFISEAKTTPNLPAEIRSLFSDRTALLKTIYLLRGLFVHRILLLALKKRWNVQYGLHPTRDPVAVPYHAKGVPSEQAEWGHPDVAILFTCLSFYYHGLNMDQLGQSLRFVLQSDDPASEYDRWAHSSQSLPGSLKEWNSINVDDEVQLTEIWGHVRYNVVVIDHFLNNFVFPRHAKQFLNKLQASGWDIPLFLDGGRGHGRYGTLTTGFSGTNDNKTMLPLTVTQEDLPTLSHTNAEVLTYLLQPRNRIYCLAANTRGRRWSETDLLKKLKGEGIRILIDAGAQILEMDNLELVTAWMAIDGSAPAAIYFDKFNKPFVLYRNNTNVPLLATPYAEDSGECLIYLDESHTRGTDLKMPTEARGALTLGLGQTKDQTVQAAMRLRQLGTTQSIMFFAPPEVHQSIVDTQQKQFYEPIDSRDVISWLLQQTCAGIEQLQPLYFSQGMDFCRRIQAASDNPDFLEDPVQLREYLEILRQHEQQTLRQMYEPKQYHKPNTAMQNSSYEIGKFINELKIRRRNFQDTGEAVHGSALQEVEQEREVAFEVESVREVQKPIHYTPYKFGGLHKDLVAFVHTGRALVGTGAYEPAFLGIRRTCSLGEKYSVDHNATSGYLYSSIEFSKTVHPVSSRFNDNFQRPVNWILISTKTNVAIIITPEEAEYLIPHVNNKSRDSPVHLITYAAPITRKMVQFDSLRFLSIPALPEGWNPPPKLSVELGIISGRLYFAYEHSADLKDYLDLKNEGLEETMAEAIVFTGKPLSFLQEWLTLKRKGQDFLHTPMGYLCQGKALFRNHPFFGDGALGATVVERQVQDLDLGEEYIDDSSETEAKDMDFGIDEIRKEHGSLGSFST